MVVAGEKMENDLCKNLVCWQMLFILKQRETAWRMVFICLTHI